MAREQLNTLTYSELSALAARLTESAETVVRNPSLRADLHQAASAVSDLASIKFNGGRTRRANQRHLDSRRTARPNRP
jgi:hypothetical protein